MGNKDPRTTTEFLLKDLITETKAVAAAIGGGGVETLTPSLVEVSGGAITTDACESLSLYVDSTDATIDGVLVPNGYGITFQSSGLETVAGIDINPGTGRILVSYLKS